MEQKCRAQSANFIILDTYRAEFDKNGPLMAIIIEYLLNPAAAFAYALQMPDVKAVARLAAQSDPTQAARYAIQTKNRRNMEVLVWRHRDDMHWGKVFEAGAMLGNTAIMRELRTYCAKSPAMNIHTAMRIASQRGFLKLMEEMVNWGADPNVATHVATSARTIRKAMELGANTMESAFKGAAFAGNIGMLRFIHGESKREGDEPIPIEILEESIEAACSVGRVKVVRHLLGLYPRARLNVNAGLLEAANGGHVHLCRFLLNPPNGELRWFVSADARKEAVLAAASNSRIAVLRILREPSPWIRHVWSRELANQALTFAASAGNTRIAKILWDGADGIVRADDANRMLCAAARNFQCRAMHQARAWGATAFELALERAVVPGTSARALLEKWISER